MPSSSTNYSYDIPTVGSDSTTYGTLINQFVNSLSTKLKAVSDAINTAGVGATSTLAQINRNIAQVDAINSRLPAGVADLLPDPYSGSLTPVSTWPYLNTELTAEGFSPPTTAQEVLDFDYSGFATYLNTRFDSLSARIVGLDAPITISDSSTLVCETNAILDTIGTYKTVTTTTVSNLASSASFYSITGSKIVPNIYMPFGGKQTVIYSSNNDALASALAAEGVGTVGRATTGDRRQGHAYSINIRAMDVDSAITNKTPIDAGIYINTTLKDKFVNLQFERIYNYSIDSDKGPWFLNVQDSLSSWGSTGSNPEYLTLNFVKVTNSNSTVTTSTQVKKTIDDVDFSGCT